MKKFIYFYLFISITHCSLIIDFCRAQWIQTNGPYGGQIASISVSGSELYAGTYYSGIFHSTNSGANWNAVNNGLPDYTASSVFYFGSNVFAGMGGGVGFFHSTNSGISWVQYSGFNNYNVSCFLLSGSSLYVGTYHIGSGGYTSVFRSTNNGTNWIPTGGELDGNAINDLIASGTNLFAGTSLEGIYMSTNNGTNWTQAGLMGYTIEALALSGSNLFAGSYHGGVLLSTNNGTNWTQVNNGLPSLPSVSDLAFSGSNLFAAIQYSGGASIFTTTNNGTNWTTINNGLPSNFAYTFDVSNSNLFAGTFDGVFLTTNNGTLWNGVNSGLNATIVKTFAISGTNLFAGNIGGGVHISTNGGVNWLPVNLGMPSTNILALAVSGTSLFLLEPGAGELFVQQIMELTGLLLIAACQVIPTFFLLSLQVQISLPELPQVSTVHPTTD